MKPDFFVRLDTFPPLVCRLLARRITRAGGVEAKPAEDISKDSGLRLGEVNSLSWHTSWDDVPVKLVRRFALGCGVDFTSRDSMRLQSGYLRRRPSFKYLKKSPLWSSVYEPLIKIYVSQHAEH